MEIIMSSTIDIFTNARMSYISKTVLPKFQEFDEALGIEIFKTMEYFPEKRINKTSKTVEAIDTIADKLEDAFINTGIISKASKLKKIAQQYPSLNIDKEDEDLLDCIM